MFSSSYTLYYLYLLSWLEHRSLPRGTLTPPLRCLAGYILEVRHRQVRSHHSLYLIVEATRGDQSHTIITHDFTFFYFSLSSASFKRNIKSWSKSGTSCVQVPFFKTESATNFYFFFIHFRRWQRMRFLNMMSARKISHISDSGFASTISACFQILLE